MVDLNSRTNSERPWEVAGTRPHTDEERKLAESIPYVKRKEYCGVLFAVVGDAFYCNMRYTAGKYHDLHHLLTPDIPMRPFRDCTNPVCTNARDALRERGA